MISEILNTYALNIDWGRRLVADLGPDQMVGQTSGAVNHPAWTIGHLVYSAQCIAGEIGLEPWLPSDWAERFGTDSKPVAESGMYPNKATLLGFLEDAQQRLAKALELMSEEELSKPLPDARFRDTFPSLGHAVLHILSAHTAVHVGQLIAWRQGMGLTDTSD